MPKKAHNLPLKVFYLMPVVLLAALFSVYFFWEKTVIICILLVILSIAQLSLTNFKQIKTFLTVALIGPLFEIIAIRAGAWNYPSNQILGIPLWLPLLWGIAGICFVTAANFYNESRVE